MLDRHNPCGNEHQDNLYGGEAHDSGKRYAVVYHQHLFGPSSNKTRLKLLRLALSVSLSLLDPDGVQCV